MVFGDVTTAELYGHLTVYFIARSATLSRFKRRASQSTLHCSTSPIFETDRKVHFTACSTGEKVHECPDYTNDSSGSPTQRCEYRTNDPAALSKHRKKIHGYVPPANRTRAREASASPRKVREKKDENAPRRCRRSQRPPTASRRRPSRVARTTKNATCGPLIRVENVDGEVIDVDSYVDGCETSGMALVDSDDEMRLDTLYDSTLRSEWMAKYEEGYSTFSAGMKCLPEPLHIVSPSVLMDIDAETRTGREGCLCPEWMVEAGIDGWDASVVEDLQVV